MVDSLIKKCSLYKIYKKANKNTIDVGYYLYWGSNYSKLLVFLLLLNQRLHFITVPSSRGTDYGVSTDLHQHLSFGFLWKY